MTRIGHCDGSAARVALVDGADGVLSAAICGGAAAAPRRARFSSLLASVLMLEAGTGDLSLVSRGAIGINRQS